MPVSGPTYKQVTGSATSGGPSVTGTTSSVDNTIVRWDGVSGSDLQGSGVSIDDANILTGVTTTGIGGAASTAMIVRVGGLNPLTDTSQYGVGSVLAGSTQASNAIFGFFSGATTAASVSTAVLADFYANAQPKGSGSTISRRAAFASAGIPSTGNLNCLLTDAPSTFSGGPWGIYIESTNANYIGGPVRVGVSTGQASAFETFTNYRNYTGTASNATYAMDSVLDINTNDALSATNANAGFTFKRVVTADVTDTTSGGIGFNTNLFIGSNITADSGHTYTYTDGDGFSEVAIRQMVLGAGTTAITNYKKIHILTDTGATGANKYGLWMDTISGGSSSNFQLYILGTSPNYFAGQVRIGTAAGARLSSNEKATIYSTYGGTASGNYPGLAIEREMSTNDALTGGSQAACYIINRRIATEDVTDAPSGGISTICSLGVSSRFTISAGKTYTVTSQPISQLYVQNTTIDLTGTLAITNYYKTWIAPDSAATGTTKVALKIGAMTGATNNYQIYSDGTAPSYFGGNLRVGTTTPNTGGAAKEQLSIFHNPTSATGNANIGINVQQYLTEDAAYTVNANAAIFARIRRNITASQTDTSDLNAAINVNVRFNIASGQTYTNAQADGFSGLLVSTPPNDGTGTLAISSYAGLNVAASTLATGTNKYGIKIGDQSGATNNYSIYTGTAASSFHGAICTLKNDIASAASITALDSAHSFVKLTGSTATTLHGILAGKDGQRLTLFNNTGQNLTIKHQSGSAAAADQITTMTGADVTTTGNGFAEFIYDITDSKWICVSVNP